MYEYPIRRIIAVVDGDTVRAEVDLGFRSFQVVEFRLLGIDAPEMRGDQKVAGEAAKKFLVDNLTGFTGVHDIKVISTKTEKYGRWLGEFFVNGVNLNRELVKLALAKDYDGGKR